jgi:hypothetical protein
MLLRHWLKWDRLALVVELHIGRGHLLIVGEGSGQRSGMARERKRLRSAMQRSGSRS